MSPSPQPEITRLLAEQWPDAKVHGLDNSPEMLNKAAAEPSTVKWIEADIQQWSPGEAADLIYSNATLQWVTDHQELFPRLAGYLQPGGCLAVQMPLSWGMASHRLMRETLETGDTDGGELAPVDMITGPGNIYVTAAKRICRSQVGIDAEAGPTEIAILADRTADPVHVAADLISQAEHDVMAASVLVTDSTELAAATDIALADQLKTTKHRDRVTTALTGSQSGIVLVDDIDTGIRVVNSYAAEHLEIQTADAPGVARQIRAAGAIFVGPWSPVSLGDYCAGSNHVLPTAGCARHSSGLSVQTFLRGIHVVDCTEAALKDVSGYVITLANAEDLPAHGEAVRRRFER